MVIFGEQLNILHIAWDADGTLVEWNQKLCAKLWNTHTNIEWEHEYLGVWHLHWTHRIECRMHRVIIDRFSDIDFG